MLKQFIFALSLSSLIGLSSIEAVPQLNLMKDAEISTLSPFVNSQKGYQISLPSAWDRKQNEGEGIDIFSVNLKTGQSVSVIVSDKIDIQNLNQFVDDSLKELKVFTEEFHLIDRGTAKLDGKDSEWILYTGALSQNRGKILQYLISSNQRLYILTFGSLEEDFDISRPIFDEIAQSFRFVDH